MTNPFKSLMARLFGHPNDTDLRQTADLQKLQFEIDEQLNEIYGKLAKVERQLLRVQNHLPQTPSPGKSRKGQPSFHIQGVERFYRRSPQAHKALSCSAYAQAALDEL